MTPVFSAISTPARASRSRDGLAVHAAPLRISRFHFTGPHIAAPQVSSSEARSSGDPGRNSPPESSEVTFPHLLEGPINESGAARPGDRLWATQTMIAEGRHPAGHGASALDAVGR